MATSKSTIKNEILAFIQELNSGDVTKKTKEEVEEEFADKLAAVVQNAIRSADVEAGIQVQVTPSSGTGATVDIGSLL